MGKGGKDWLLQRSDGETPEGFDDIGGLRSAGFTGDSEAIDATSHDSDQNKELLDEAGINSYKIAGSGIATSNAILDSIENDFMDRKIRRYRVIDVSAGGKSWTGSFKIVSFERTGEYNGVQTWSISLESSGEVVRA
jgi:TP901-1 family phage major tail protein